MFIISGRCLDVFMQSAAVSVRREPVVFPTYLPAAPDKNPIFFERRVYQGSSGKVYPIPYTDRVAEGKKEVAWDAVHLENEYLYVMVLPQIGGRIHVAKDKTNGYDFFYRQNVIKPALVSLAGSWISGGAEFNWPQHHRPTTFMPTDVEIEKHDDGSVTVWFGEHEPLNRMKGMHGVCLHPGKALLEVKARVYNRTPLTQTFLWWANVATQVHEQYQSFFPPDVTHIADHAKRATSEFPLCKGHYYGIDYGARGKYGVPKHELPANYVPDGSYPANDLSWYANIPVPTSYMAMGSKEDYLGGYDYKRRAGVIQIANHHISPGKKQWTWGNHEFGYSWDNNLTDGDGPYIELMTGVYTDNQPDFSFLMPGETKTWSQYWYPIQEIGAAQQANLRAALALKFVKGVARVGVSVTEPCLQGKLTLTAKGKKVAEWICDLAPGKSFTAEGASLAGVKETDLCLSLTDKDGNEWIHYAPQTRAKRQVPPPATEPPPPAEIAANDELYVTGLHLDQYRHATRSPEPYWQEALRRDPLDSRCNTAMGLRCLRRGEFAKAEQYFQQAITRQTRRNPNPADGEAYYHLGLALAWQGRDEEAYAALYKATWNQAWCAAGFHALAELDAKARRWAAAWEHLERALRYNADNLAARNLLALVLRKLGETVLADACLAETLRLDPLNWAARWLRGDALTCNLQTKLDISVDLLRAGLHEEMIGLLSGANGGDLLHEGAEPMRLYYLAFAYQQIGDNPAAKEHYRRAATANRDYCFPSRLEDLLVLEAAISANPQDAAASYYLGNLLYDKGRQKEALKLWERSAGLDGKYSVVWRNLGIAYFNVSGNPRKALAAYEKAFAANRKDGRLLFERDRLWKCTGKSWRVRLRELEQHAALVNRRDDLSLELCALYNYAGKLEQALTVIASRKFQPWEGGEGGALAQYVRTCLALGRRALANGGAEDALKYFQRAMDLPESLGEKRHLLANASDVHYWLGCAYAELGQTAEAKRHWSLAAQFQGDFQGMSVTRFSELTYYTALALRCLKKSKQADKLLGDLLSYAKTLMTKEAKIDYFATSMPQATPFHEDLTEKQRTAALFLQAQALFGLGKKKAAKELLKKVLARDAFYAPAWDFAVEIEK